MSPQEPGPGEPTREHPAGGHHDGGAAPSGGMGHVPPAVQQPWAPPAGGQAWQQPAGGQAWQQPHPWQQQSPGSPYGTAPYGYSPYGQPRYAAPPKPGIVPLRPLMFGEILDGAFQAIRRNAKAMFGAALLAQSLAAIVGAAAVTATSVHSLEAWANAAGAADIAQVGIGFIAAAVVFSILAVFVSVVLQGAMVVPVARSVLNRRTGFRQMWQLSRSRTWALVRLAALLMAAGVLAVVLLGAAMALLFSNARGLGILMAIPLFFVFALMFAWVAVKLLVAPAAVVVEELGAIAGLRRSWELTRANWWRVFGITTVVSILVGVISQVVLIPVTFLASFLSTVVSPHGGSGQQAATAVAAGIATAVLGALAGAVGYAFQTSVMALLYLDLRMRQDGLDITLLRQHESGADPGVPGRGVLPGMAGPYPGYGAGSRGWPDGR